MFHFLKTESLTIFFSLRKELSEGAVLFLAGLGRFLPFLVADLDCLSLLEANTCLSSSLSSSVW